MPKPLQWVSDPARRSCAKHRLMPGSITRSTIVIRATTNAPSINRQVPNRTTERQAYFCAMPGCSRSGTTVAYREKFTEAPA